VEDPQAKKIGLELLENVIADEKDRIKKAKLPDMKKYLTIYDKVWNCFLDLFKTLESYAVHLIKVRVKRELNIEYFVGFVLNN